MPSVTLLAQHHGSEYGPCTASCRGAFGVVHSRLAHVCVMLRNASRCQQAQTAQILRDALGPGCLVWRVSPAALVLAAPAALASSASGPTLCAT